LKDQVLDEAAIESSAGASGQHQLHPPALADYRRRRLEDRERAVALR
jgi:hypothetical protein